jgi:enoyl-CoA hydratase/carnithine racemase
MSDAPHLLTEEDGAILIATLNRPDKLNALSGSLMELFEAALHRFRDTPAFKVMLVRANGRYFCAGADLHSGNGSPQPATASAVRARHRLGLHGMHRIYDEMEAIEKPIVVAHHATCVGGGLELSMSCDFRLAAKSARYAFPEGKFGVLPASNGVSRLTRFVGTHWARYLIMANLPVDADRALLMKCSPMRRSATTSCASAAIWPHRTASRWARPSLPSKWPGMSVSPRRATSSAWRTAP